MNAKLKQFIADMPKAENHLHILGAIPPDTAISLARKKKIPLPAKQPQELMEYYRPRIKNLTTFLDCLRTIKSLCTTAEDYFEVVLALGKDAASQNILYREIMLDFPMNGEYRLFSEVVNACDCAIKEAKRNYGVEQVLIVCIDRTCPADVTLNFVKGFEPHLDQISAIGMDFDEIGHPSAKHRAAFELAGSMGLYRTCHAGEDEGPSNIWQALDILKCRRIDHGVRAIEDEVLLNRLISEKILLALCPRSNIVTGLFPSLEQHPLKKFMDLGVTCSISSDDPFFWGNLTEEYIHAAEALQLSEKDIIKLARNSFEYSIKGAHHLDNYEKWLNSWKHNSNR